MVEYTVTNNHTAAEVVSLQNTLLIVEKCRPLNSEICAFGSNPCTVAVVGAGARKSNTANCDVGSRDHENRFFLADFISQDSARSCPFNGQIVSSPNSTIDQRSR